jgi:hypothetical protein
LLALASLIAATAWPSATLAAYTRACDELAPHPRDVFLVACLGRGEMTNWSSPSLELIGDNVLLRGLLAGWSVRHLHKVAQIFLEKR